MLAAAVAACATGDAAGIKLGWDLEAENVSISHEAPAPGRVRVRSLISARRPYYSTVVLEKRAPASQAKQVRAEH